MRFRAALVAMILAGMLAGGCGRSGNEAGGGGAAVSPANGT